MRSNGNCLCADQLLQQPTMQLAAAALVVCLAVCAAASEAGPQQLPYDLPPTGHPAPPLVLKEGSILQGSDGRNLTLKAALWGDGQHSGELFSSFVHSCRPEAAAVGNNSASSISKALVFTAYQLRQQGFNAIVLPFSFQDLQESSAQSTSNSTQHCTQVPLPSPASTGAATGTPETGAAAGSSSHGSKAQTAQLLHQWQHGSTRQQPCLSLLPGTSTLDRFLWSVRWFVSNGLYVILGGDSGDQMGSCSTAAVTHSSGSRGGSSSGDSGGGNSSSDGSSSSDSCVKDASVSAEAWAKLWEAVVSLPGFQEAVAGRVLLQLAPGSGAAGQRWESGQHSSGQRQPGLQELYLAIMDAVDAAAPGTALFVLPGPQQPAPAGAAASEWGNGFNAAPALLHAGLTDPTGLFKALLTKPYKYQVVLAPQVHPPQPANTTGSSSGASSGGSVPAGAVAAAVDNVGVEGAHSLDGSTPVKVLDTSFQGLSHVGFCVAEGNCLRAPVLVAQQQEQQQEQGLGHKSQDSQRQQAAEAEEDFQRFAEFVLGAQGANSNRPDGDTPTGDWFRWDMSQQGHPTGRAGSSSGQQHAGPKPDSSSSSSSKTGATGSHEPHDSPQQQGQQLQDGVMAFVYTAEDGDNGSIKVFDARDDA